MFRGDFMRRFRKIAALLLALSLAAGLAACGGAPQEQELPAPDEPDAVDTVGEGLVSTLVIKQEALPGGLAELSAMNTAGEGLILAGWDAAASPVLGTLGEDGGFSALTLPEDVVSVEAVCRDGEAIAALAATETGMCVLSLGGGQDSRTELDADDASMLYGDLALAVQDGKFYILYYMGIAEFGPDGKAARACYGPEKWSCFTSMQEVDGHIYVAVGDGMNGGGSLCELDTGAMSLTSIDTGELGVKALGLSAEGGLLLSGSLGVRDIVAALGEGEPTELFDWAEPGVAIVSCLSIWEQPDGSYVLYQPGDTVLERLTEELAAPKTELVLLTDYAGSEMYDLVNAFNRENPDYKVRVESLNDEGMSMELLNTQLIAGDGPDIFAFCYYDNLMRLGPAATVDLLPYLDADGEYSRESILPSLLEAMSPQGKLSALPYTFSLVTFTAPEDVIAEPGVTFAEAKAAADEADLPLFPLWMTRETLWGWMEEFAAVQFTDLEAGTCSFDSEEYIGLLRECGETSTDFPADISQNYVGLLQFEPLQGYMRLSVISGNYGGEYTFAGMPNDETNGSMFNIELSYAISAQSKHADGAWQFIRRCLGQERGVSSMGFPANAELFAEQLQSMVETGYDNYGQLVKISESDAEKLRGLVEGTTTVNYSLPTVSDILSEDAAQYFAGQISVEQAAAYSQERVNTWLAEQG